MLQVIGIWFYDITECAQLAGLLQRITAAFAGQVPQAGSSPLQVGPRLLFMAVLGVESCLTAQHMAGTERVCMRQSAVHGVSNAHV